MKFKKFLRVATFALLMAITVPASSATIVPESSGNAKTEDTRGQQLAQRLSEIKDMDKSGLSHQDKKALRKEVVTIKKEMKKISGGVYLSAGAIIIIILVLLLLT